MMVALTRIIAGEVKRNRLFILNLEQIALVGIECVVRDRKKKDSGNMVIQTIALCPQIKF